MRKFLMLVALLVLPLMVTKAQEKAAAQAPIIAMADGKLYRVSPEDGAATVLADAGADQTITPLRVESISPDGKYFVYVEQSTFDTQKVYKSDLFLVTVADGTVETITPKGGVFDVPVTKDERVVLDMPTWSYDGTRIYYYRSTYSTSATSLSKPVLFAYYDLATSKHELVSRIDPKNLLDNLEGVKEGIVTRWYQPGAASSTILTLYGLDNKIITQTEINVPYVYSLRGEDETYFVQLKDFGDIDFKVGAFSNVEEDVGDGYYPAAQSMKNGDKSMHIFSTQTDINRYEIYGADYHTYIIGFDNDTGFNFALSPDGQQMAYLKYGQELKAPIRILDMKGKTRELPFEAEQILWGATEFVPFYAPG